MFFSPYNSNGRNIQRDRLLSSVFSVVTKVINAIKIGNRANYVPKVITN